MDSINIEARDIIAVVIIVACFILIGLGIDHLVSAILICVVSFYFGHGTISKTIEGVKRHAS